MKKTILAACLCGLLAACGNVEEEAGKKLQEARQAYEAGNYNEAKLLIDSIKILYPKAYDTRRAGNYLLQEVELSELGRTLAYLDSVQAERNKQLEEMKKDYVLEKDEEYQQIGRYLHPLQVIERNMHRSFLRFQVDETGKMSMTSIYCGPYNIHHTAVKVIAPDGTFAQTPSSRDSYETTDMDEHIEKADYPLGEDGSVISFICDNRDKNLRVQYLGERPYTTNMMPVDRKAAAGVYQLHLLLAEIQKIKADKEEAQQKTNFIKQLIQRRETSDE